MVGLATLVRRFVFVAQLALVLGVIGLAAGARLAPAAGHELVIIRGGSMEPTMPFGSLAVVGRADAGAVRPGDVVTVRADNGVLITHRVVRTTDAAGEIYLEMQGDANAQPDGVLAPGRTVVGVVRVHLPVLGTLLALLSLPTGVLSLLALLAASILLTELLHDGTARRRPGRPDPRAPGAQPAPTPDGTPA